MLDLEKKGPRSTIIASLKGTCSGAVIRIHHPIFWAKQEVPDLMYQILPSNGTPHPRPTRVIRHQTAAFSPTMKHNGCSSVCRRRKQSKFRAFDQERHSRLFHQSVVLWDFDSLLLTRRNTVIRLHGPVLLHCLIWEKWKQQAVEILEPNREMNFPGRIEEREEMTVNVS